MYDNLGYLESVTDNQNRTVSEQHHSTPPINDTFDEIVEVSFSHKENTITLAEWAHEKTYKLNIPKGNYRLRYSIKNMEKEYTENDDYTSFKR